MIIALTIAALLFVGLLIFALGVAVGGALCMKAMQDAMDDQMNNIFTRKK